jgi:heme oxygenase
LQIPYATGTLPAALKGMRVFVPALDQLRKATRPLHDALEARLDIVGRLADPERRLELLARLYGFHEPAETALSPILRFIPLLRFEARRKTPFLARDLAALGMTRADIAQLARCPIGAFRTPAEALGFFYVLEGATLGGHVIRKEAEKRGLDPVGLSFFDCYGAHRREMWRRFCAILEENCGAADRMGEAADGANRGFRLIRSWLGGSDLEVEHGACVRADA